MRLLNAIRYDMLFQFRHRFYHAYLVITILYIILLKFLPGTLKPIATIILLFSDTAALGFFFIGAIILLEKDQHILDCLFVTPLRITEYVLAKIVSLAIISLVSSLAIVVFTFGISENLLVFIPGFLCVTSFYTLIGILFSLISKSVNDYFAKTLVVGLVAAISILPYFSLLKSPIFSLMPTLATLTLIDVLFKAHPRGEIIFAFCNVGFWLLVTSFFVRRIFNKYILFKAGSVR
ncbi:MAG: hypothetical protein H6696_00335 [Deferribacteres bacterium]|nr:hypothetical protein [candidate division KSB1 bacterium]MCB9500352.1 hypothetical protein [Deferribacteres bacterium]